MIKRGSLLLIPYFTAALIDRVVQGKPFLAPETALIIAAALLLLVINCVSNFWFDRILYSRKLREIEAALKLAALEKIQTLSMEKINSLSSGELLHKVIQDTNQVRLLMTKAVEGGFQFLVDLTMILIMTLSSSPAMLLFFLVTIQLTVFLILKFKEPIRVKTEELRRQQARVTGVIRDMQEMQVLTRIHGLQKTETRIYAWQLNRARRAGDEYDNVFHSFSTASFFIFEFFKLFCLTFSAFLASRSIITVGMVLLFQSYFESMVNSVTKLIEALPEITQGYDGLKSLNEILCLNESEQNGSHILGADMRGEIEFRNVVFRYDNDKQPVIDHLSFRIPAGKSAAFVGESGSGKSTVLNLMAGLLHKESGNILIDGVDIDDIDMTSYHPKIAVVPQTTTLFAGSLLDNLVFGNPYVLTEEVADIIEKIGLSDVIKALPDGFYSSVSESGKNFSGGQRQRIAIARALLRKPKILFFDEATSALDQDSEKQIQNAVDSMMGKCTMVIIAHRLTTIRKCDLIIRLSRNGARIYEGYDAFMKGLKTVE